MSNFKFRSLIVFVFTLFVCYTTKSQTLIMNEVSNGLSGTNGEYVEFVVVSNTVTYSCSSSTPPCIDIRGWIFDDNSGYHGTSGIAAGAVRFSQNPLWSCIPLGTIILIYNKSDKNPAIPPDDLSMSDGNCTIIAPVDGTLFETTSTTPGAVACSYPSGAGTWSLATAGTWSLSTALANGGDCARIVNLAGCEVFSVCYGTDNLNTEIFFAGNGGQKVYYFNDIDPTNQANWTSGDASVTPGDQTPGAPNNALNAAYIAQFNNGCMPITSISVTATSVNAGCTCSGSATATASGSIGGYTYVWYDAMFNPIGQTSASATNLCAGVYNVIATSHIGCSDTTSVSIGSSSSVSVTVNSQTVCVGNTATLIATPSTVGGTYLWLPGGLTTSSISVNPTSTITYSVTYSLSGCSGTNKGAVTVTPLPTVGINSPTICSGQSTTISAVGASSFVWSNGSLTNSISVSPTSTTSYTVVGTTGGCSNTAVSNVSVTALPNVTVVSPTLCSGQTITITANGASTYIWNNGITNNSISVSPTSSANYTVVGSINGCSNTAVSTVIVNPLPPIVVNSSTICVGQTATLTAIGANTYTWSTGDNTASISYSPTSTTTYSVVGSLQSCTNIATASITIEPNLNISVNSPTVCAGQTATVTAIGALTYTWSNGVVGNPLIVSTSSSQSYSVVGLNGTCTGSTIASVVVNLSPTLTVNSPTICSNQTATLIANGASTYTWSTGSFSPLLIVSPISNTSYSLIGITSGCSNTIIANVSVVSSPVLTISPLSICAGETATLVASGATSYVWNSGVTTNTIVVSPITSSSYSVVGAIGVCSSSAATNVTVNPLPNITVSSQTICARQSTSITASGANTYSWSTGSTSNVLITSPNTTTIYSVTGTKLGCSNTATVGVFITPAPLITFSVNKASGCNPLCVQFTDLTSVSSGSITNWNWLFDNGTTSNIQNPSHCFDNAGTYNISLTTTSSNGCSKTYTNPNMIYVYPTPVAEFSGDPSITDITNPSIEFTNLSSSANMYSWNFGDLATSNQINPTHIYSNEGSYTVTLKASNQFGCVNTIVHDIIIKPLFTFYAPNTFTPNNDDINDVFLPLGVGWDPDKYQLDIFDRWGNNCFNTTQVGKGWDGKANNGAEIAQIDTYTWKIQLSDIFGVKHKYIGRITLMK